MKWFVDKDGNIIEKPETLIERLQQTSPEHAQKLDSVIQSRQILDRYRFFLYAMPHDPNELQKDRTAWEQFIRTVDSQEGLEQMIGMLDQAKRFDYDLTNDRVVVVQSDGPFLDTLSSGAKFGSAQGWIGEVESYNITDVKDARLYSLDGKIMQRFVLKNARPLMMQDIKRWADAITNLMFFHDETKEYFGLLDEFENYTLGDKRVVIYDKYPNIDFAMLKHELKPEEKAVENISIDIPYDERCVNLQAQYGPQRISNSRITLVDVYLGDTNGKEKVLIGRDSSELNHLYNLLEQAVAVTIPDHSITAPRTEIIVGKMADTQITAEEKKRIEKMPSMYGLKWKKKYFDERGITITDETLLSVRIFTHDGVDQEKTGAVFETLKKLFPQYIENTCSIGYRFPPTNKFCLKEDLFDFYRKPAIFASEVMRWD